MKPSAPPSAPSEPPPPYPGFSPVENQRGQQGDSQTSSGQFSYGSAHQQAWGPPPPPPPSYMQPPRVNVSVQRGVPMGMGPTVVITTPYLGPSPSPMTCPKCMASVVTEITFVSGALTWLLVCGLFIVGCAMGCCLIPFCVNDCQDVEHRCPNCKVYLGTYRRI